MAVRHVGRTIEDAETEIRRLMADRGLTRDAAELVVAVERGYAIVGDREEIQPDRRDALLDQEEAAERAYLAGSPPA